jgi:hypothetical protein
VPGSVAKLYNLLRPRRAIHMRVNNRKCDDLYGVFAITPDGLVTFLSSFGPKETMHRLAAELANRGVTTLARIDHAAAAARCFAIASTASFFEAHE